MTFFRDTQTDGKLFSKVGCHRTGMLPERRAMVTRDGGHNDGANGGATTTSAGRLGGRIPEFTLNI